MFKSTPRQEIVLLKARLYLLRASRLVGQSYIMAATIYTIAALLGVDVSQEGWGAIALVVGSLGVAGLITFFMKLRLWETQDDDG